ncbi:MAG: 50S ribosomal protein L6 [Deltaproteobacteria bacterium]|nr:50S ribosomal protein L6 [Deltaproteobacteria bacterium]
MSRIGKRPVELKGVTLTVGADHFEVKGPKGTVRRPLLAGVGITTQDGVAQVAAKPDAPASIASMITGTTRSHLNNAVTGARDGYKKTLKLVGTGYRAELKGQTLTMALGLSHPVVYELPASIKAEIPPESKNTQINLTSVDKDLLGQVTADLKGFRPPEPYKGKGVTIEGQKYRRKAGKAGKTGAVAK